MEEDEASSILECIESNDVHHLPGSTQSQGN
jgi:hypothetical protein